MSGMYLSVKASLLKICKGVSDHFLLDSPPSIVLQVFDFDSHAVEAELPLEDLMGVGEYQIQNDGGVHSGSCTFAICTMTDDTDLSRLSQVIDYFYDLMKDQKNFPIVDPSTGTELGKLAIMSPISALPVGSTRTRPFQQVMVNFGVLLPEDQQ